MMIDLSMWLTNAEATCAEPRPRRRGTVTTNRHTTEPTTITRVRVVALGMAADERRWLLG